MLWSQPAIGLDLLIYITLLPALLFVAPWLAVRYVFATDVTRQLPYFRHAPLLWTSALVWLIGFVLPNIPFSPETSSFTLHTCGGVLAGLLGLYIVRAYGIRFTAWWQPALFFYGVGSSLGIANELFEFFLSHSGIVYINLNDTAWDLVANTSGIVIFTTAYYALRTRR